MKKIQVDKNGCKYILLRIDICFIKFLLAVEIDEKGHTGRDLIFDKKIQEAPEKKLGCKFFRINTSNAKNGYDSDCEVGNIEAFIDKFKNKKIKELEDKIKEKEEESNKKKKRTISQNKRTRRQNKNSTTNQITNNFEKIIIKN